MIDVNLSGVHSVERLLIDRGFPQFEGTRGRASVADLFKPGRRCGIYVLVFSDGKAYVGQSVDVVRRYAQHLRVHQDIEAISFKSVAPEDLDEAEQTLIRLSERAGHQLRNVVFSALPPLESDFDLVMSPDEQERWLSDPDLVDISGARFTNDALRRKYEAKYLRFRAQDGTGKILEQVRCYVRRGIPAMKRTEVSFWSISCLPSYADPEITLFLRVNVYWQEVMTMFREKNSGADCFSLHVAKKPIEEDAKLCRGIAGVEILEHQYAPGGHDQVSLVGPSEMFDAVMARPCVKRAIREFNHRLMKKGPCNFARYHCLDLADVIFDV